MLVLLTSMMVLQKQSIAPIKSLDYFPYNSSRIFWVIPYCDITSHCINFLLHNNNDCRYIMVKIKKTRNLSIIIVLSIIEIVFGPKLLEIYLLC